MLKTTESSMAKAKPAAVVPDIREGGVQKKNTTTPKGKGKGKGKVGNPNSKPKPKSVGESSSSKVSQVKDPKEVTCFHCGDRKSVV